MVEIGDYSKYIDSNKQSLSQIETENVIKSVQAELNWLKNEVMQNPWKNWWNVETLDAAADLVDDFYTIENNQVTYHLDKVYQYLTIVYNRLDKTTWPKKYSDQVKEKVFDWSVLAIQIVLKALSSDPKNSKNYNIWFVNWNINTSREAIRQYQTDCSLKYKDGKPWKETIKSILNSINKLKENKILEVKEKEIVYTNVKNIIEESINRSPAPWFFGEDLVDAMTKYLVEWKMDSKADEKIESRIKSLSNQPWSLKLRYLLLHAKDPMKWNIAVLKEYEKIMETKPMIFKDAWDDAAEIDKIVGTDKISNDMFEQLLHIEWSQGYVAHVHAKFWESFPTWPYGMVYKHIDNNWNLLKNIKPFKAWEYVSKEWALNNAKAFYNKRAAEWKDSLKAKWCAYTQDMLDALVSASWWTVRSYNRLKEFVLSNWNNKDKIYNYMISFATRDSKWNRLKWLVKRRKFEANWFKWNKQPYESYKA